MNVALCRGFTVCGEVGECHFQRGGSSCMHLSRRFERLSAGAASVLGGGRLKFHEISIDPRIAHVVKPCKANHIVSHPRYYHRIHR